MRRGRPARTAVALTSLVALSGCGAEPVRLDDSQLPPTPSLGPGDLGLPSQPVVWLGVDRDEDRLVQRGSAKVSIDVVTLDGGSIDLVTGRNDRGAIDYPPYRSTERYPRAVVRVVNDGREDQLAPGDQDFVWGADVFLDKESFGTSVDNGDNLVQRGLSSHGTFYKAEVDDDRPACTVQGQDGIVIVRAEERIEPRRWYRIRCERVGDILKVRAIELGPSGEGATISSIAQGPMGAVPIDDPTVAMTVGGKIGVDQELIGSATDQFNGLVMNPVYAIGLATR